MCQIESTSQDQGLRQRSPLTPALQDVELGPSSPLRTTFKRLLEVAVLLLLTRRLSLPWQPPGRDLQTRARRTMSLTTWKLSGSSQVAGSGLDDLPAWAGKGVEARIRNPDSEPGTHGW